MASTPTSIPFTLLVEATNNVTQSPPPAPFDAGMAYLLGQCCSLTYSQFDQDSISTTDFSVFSLLGSLQGYTISASNLQPFTASEANEPGPTTGDVGDYYQVMAGFAVRLTLTPPNNGSPQDIIVFALRGTRTWDEWLDDADGFPVPFAGITGLADGLGSVHAGFYSFYTIGTDGHVAASGEELSRNISQRAPGSIAAQVAEYVTSFPSKLPTYVTGHSLGGAVATLCALDLAYNFGQSYSELYMYSLASPRVAVGISDSFGIPLPTLGNQQGFISNYQIYVPNNYQIVHAADIVPILGPLVTNVGPLILSCAQITDPYQVAGSGATATATIANGAVTGITTNNDKYTGYLSAFPPRVGLSGGGGVGATAKASVDLLGYLSFAITNPGSGYTSAPNVEILTSGSFSQNVVNFCAQTGDIGGNHACVNTYVPYLLALANDFQ
ncbi:MAG: hypothetical protein JWM21_155 [Acidobacteria bacterium]|nr:hypothetical protein [Acidobacteriota bacterium]